MSAKKNQPARVLTADDRQYVDALTRWVEQVNRLMELVDRGLPLAGAAKATAREQFAAFKTGLRDEVKRVEQLDRRGGLAGFGMTDYLPAIRQALGDLNVRSNSIPGPAWHSELYNARITLDYPLSWIRAKR